MIPSMGVTTPQIRKIVRPVTERTWKGGPRVYHAHLAITVAFQEVLTLAKSVMVTTQILPMAIPHMGSIG